VVNDERILRERMTALEDALDAAAQGDDFASAAAVGVTTVVTTYPTSPASYFAFNPGTITSTETEGGAGTITADGSTLLYALNVGSAVPPQGTSLCIHGVGGRWVFRYDG
jgi:hypothetical protein